MWDDAELLEMAESIVADERVRILLKEELPALLGRVTARLDHVDELGRDVGPDGLAALMQAHDAIVDFDLLGQVGPEGVTMLVQARDALADFLTVVSE